MADQGTPKFFFKDTKKKQSIGDRNFNYIESLKLNSHRNGLQLHKVIDLKFLKGKNI